ncbi:MAG: hypothetical protein ACOYEV_01530 [Candidatus Nanopelagicales bacterium]
MGTDDLGTQAQEAVADVAGAVSDAAEEVQDAAEPSVVDKVQDKASGLFETAKEKVASLDDEGGFLDKLKDKIEDVVEDLKGATEDAVEDIKEFVHDPQAKMAEHQEDLTEAAEDAGLVPDDGDER